MKFVVISDTHGQHAGLKLPKGDVLMHAGDISSRGKRDEVLDFLNWFKELPHKYKIFIAGNHDFLFEDLPEEEIKAMIPDNVIYLCDSGVSIENIKIWGSPVTPWFFDWAFNRQRGTEIAKHWNLIPNDTDILITHGPVFDKLDRTIHGERVGCIDLLKKVEHLRPKIFICGHIHEAYGTQEQNGIKYINASVLDERYRLKNQPSVFEM